MRLWHTGTEVIEQFYNRKPITIQPNTIKEFSDDTAVFLLSRPEIRGKGLVQLKENDKKEDRYVEGRLNIFERNNQIYNDYLKHCEERESIRLLPLKPHEPIVKAKEIIDEYEKWVSSGKKLPEGMLTESDKEKEIVKIYVCSYCRKEFSHPLALSGHLRSHQKGDVNAVNTGAAGNTSEGKG